MGDYLRNVALRAAGLSSLRPRIASRFETPHSLGLALPRFGEETVEREISQPASPRAPEMPSRPTVATTRAADPSIMRSAPLMERVTELHSIVERMVREPAQQPETRSLRAGDAPVNRPETPPRAASDDAGDLVGPARRPNLDAVPPLLPETLRPAAPVIEHREHSTFVDRQPQFVQTTLRAAEPAFRSAPAPTAAMQTKIDQAPPLFDAAAPTVQVVIGKVTVQASFPAVHAAPPARAAASGGPRLSLERYLEQRGGRA